MSKPKVHKVEESPYRFGKNPPREDYLISICSVAQSKRVNPETTTEDDAEVTCGLCLRILEHRERKRVRAPKGVDLIRLERQRQIDKEGWTPEHDNDHVGGELAWAAVCYAAPGPVFREVHVLRSIRFGDPWPWDEEWDKRPESKPTREERIRCLVKAGALIAAEIDRLQRDEGRP